MYCKFIYENGSRAWRNVLIVAKCIVNLSLNFIFKTLKIVLIVAKCIVNVDVNDVTNGNNIVLIVAKCIVNNTTCILFKNW